MFHLGETAFQSKGDLERFKTRQMVLVGKLRECREAQLDLIKLIEEHSRDVESGDAATINNGRIQVLKDIEPRLNSLYNSFVNTARTAVYYLFGQKQNPDSVTFLLLERSLSFVQIKDDIDFECEAEKFLETVPGEKARNLIEMLRGDRHSWLQVLIGTRNRVDHDVHCPRLMMNYGIVGDTIRVAFPTISKTELQTHINLLWENLYQAVEDTVVVCLNMRMPEHIGPIRIPEDSVDSQLPFRWSLALRSDPR